MNTTALRCDAMQDAQAQERCTICDTLMHAEPEQQMGGWVDGDGFKYDSTTDFIFNSGDQHPRASRQVVRYLCMVSTCSSRQDAGERKRKRRKRLDGDG